MILLPGICEACASMQLVTGQDCIDKKALCASCGGLVFVLAGWAFPEGDRQLFNALCVAIEKSSLTVAESAQLALALADSVTSQTEQETLAVLVFWVPSLEPVRALLISNPPRARQAFSMLGLILGERGKTRDSTILSRDRRCLVGE